MGQRLGVGKVVDGHDLDILVALRSAEKVSADSSKSVNRNSYSHGSLLSEKQI
jgi:hypothetical protein